MSSPVNFEIVSISPMLTDVDPALAIAVVEIRIPKPLLEASDSIIMKIRFVYDENMPVSQVKSHVLAEARSSLRSALVELG